MSNIICDGFVLRTLGRMDFSICVWIPWPILVDTPEPISTDVSAAAGTTTIYEEELEDTTLSIVDYDGESNTS